jgi:hypothetical protein
LDRNGNPVSVWRPSNKVFAGVAEPLFRGNISTLVRYKNFTLNLSFAYHWGGVIYNQTLINRVELGRDIIPGQNVDRRVLTDRWSQPGDVVSFRAIHGPVPGEVITRGTTRFVMNDRVFQMQTATLEYRLETDWIKRMRIQNARIGVNVADIFYLSSVRRERGLEFPFARRVGLNLSLMF